MPMRSSWARLLLAALALLTVACSERGATLPNTPGTTAGTTAAGALPDGCTGDAPSPTTAPVAFVAGGRAWATTADGRRVWCLFEVRNPGPFLWGPRGDRVVLDGLEVRGVGAPVWRQPRGIETVSLTWLGANGNALAFVTPGRLNLASASLGSIELRELTPFRDATYQAVAGHPSGQALAFVIQRNGASEVWMASNNGNGQARLVAPTRARLGPLAFSAGGKALYYASRQPDGTHRLEVYSLAEGRRLEPGVDGRPGHPGHRRPARPGRHPAGRRHRQRLRRPPGRPVGAGRRAGAAPAALGVQADQRRRLARHPPGAAGRGRLRGPVRPVAGRRERRRAQAGGPRDRPGGPALARPPAPPRRPRPGRAGPGRLAGPLPAEAGLVRPGR